MAWNHSSENGIATNLDPVFGGIVDKNCDGWFAIPQSDLLPFGEAFKTKQEAIDWISEQANIAYNLN